jgi:hypothetical protein
LKCEKNNLFLDLPIRAKDICPTWRNTVFTKFLLWTLSPFFEKNYYFKCCSFELAIQKRAKQLINKCKSLAISDPFMKISGSLSLKNLEPDVLWFWKFSKWQPEVNNKIKDLHNTGANQGNAMPSLQKWLNVSPNLRPWSSIAIGNVKSCLNSFSLAERSWWVNAHSYPTWVMTEHLISTFNHPWRQATSPYSQALSRQISKITNSTDCSYHVKW